MTRSAETTPEMEVRHRVTNADGAAATMFDPAVATARSPLRSTPVNGEDHGAKDSHAEVVVQTPMESSSPLLTASATSTPPTEDDPSSEPPLEPSEAQPCISLWAFFTGEIRRGYALENEEDKFRQRREQVYTFIRIPKEMEKFMFYALLQLTDAFLYVFTFLPIRMILALIELKPVSSSPSNFSSGSSPSQRLPQRKLFPGLSNASFRRSTRRLAPAQICDLLKGIIMILCGVCIHYVDTSRMYHVIRGQAVIKLYIFFNMLDVGDRLLASFGQDILDALFWTATEPRGRKRDHLGTLPHFGLAIVYIFLHAMLMLFQATTLNVAFNSHNKALLTIMMSNNFVELKGSVFKKFEKNNLFQMSCSDARERFHLFVLLIIVITRNMTEFNWNWDHLWVILPDATMVLLAEFLVDWVKHAFITKFNEISDEVYTEYRLSLAQDLASSRQKRHAIADDADILSRRMGFCPMPLAILLFRICCQSIDVDDYFGIFLLFVAYLCLLTTKVIISIMLLSMAHAFILTDQQRSEMAKARADRMWDPRPRITRRRSLHEYSTRRRAQPRGDANKSESKAVSADPMASNQDPDVRNSEELRFFDLQRYPSDPSGMQLQARTEEVERRDDGICDPSVSPTDDVTTSATTILLPTSTPISKDISDHVSQQDHPSPGSSYCSTPSLLRDSESLIAKADLTTSSSSPSSPSKAPPPPTMMPPMTTTTTLPSTPAKPPAPPLSEVDRFTMCSNRIV